MSEQGTDAPDTGAENKVEGSDTSAEEILNPDVPDTGAETGEKPGTSQTEPSGEEGETAGESDIPEGEAVTGKKVKKRIGDLTRKNYNLQQELDRLKSEKEQLSPVAEPTAEPKQDDYEDYEDYQKAHVKWQVKTELHTQGTAQREESVKQSSARQAQDRAMDFENKADVFRETTEDFDTVAKSPEMVRFYVEHAPHLAEAIESNDKGPEIAYYLGNNPEVAIEMARMPPMQAAVEVGKLEIKLSTEPKPKAVSKAPDPISPVGGGQGVVTKEIWDMEGDEFDKARRAQIAKRNQ